jgi:hypothetical protein
MMVVTALTMVDFVGPSETLPPQVSSLIVRDEEGSTGVERARAGRRRVVRVCRFIFILAMGWLGWLKVTMRCLWDAMQWE